MTIADDLAQQGLAAAAAGRFEEAVTLFRRASEEAPTVRQHRANLGLGLVRLGRIAEAEAAYRTALALEPGHASTLAKLGRLLAAQRGRSGEAVALLEAAAAADPANPDTHNALGAALAAVDGAEGAARVHWRRAIELDPAFGEAWRNLGLLEARSLAWPAAASALARAVDLEPPSGDLYYQLGVALAGAGRGAEAERAYARAVELEPRFAEAWNNLGHQRAGLGQPAAALEAVERALTLKPAYTAARYNLGVTLQALGRDDEARRAYQLVLAAEGGHADALNNLGGLCLSQANPTAAIPLYERALEAAPAHPEARWNLGLAQLASGDYARGWPNYEARRAARPYPASSAWPGPAAAPLEGLTILLWCEQGLGDAVQFLRYVELVRAHGAARVVVECPARLAPLVRLAVGVDEVIERGAAPPVFDCHASVMSLPYLFSTRWETVPAPGPRYDLGNCAVVNPASPGARRFRVGLVWGGNPENRKGRARSLPVAVLASAGLFDVPGVEWVSLQHGEQAAELEQLPGAVRERIAAPAQPDLATAARLAAGLDLVITVDTLMAHLAGTVCPRTWVLLPFAADWRWMTARTDSPWYPDRMRLFRQPRPGDWATLAAAELVPALRDWLAPQA